MITSTESCRQDGAYITKVKYMWTSTEKGYFSAGKRVLD